MGHVFTCDVCKREIQDDEQVRLLRAMAALPEEPTYAAHARCLERFQEESEDQWEVFELSDPLAAWAI